MFNIFKKILCKHDYEVVRWRLIHFNDLPLTRQVECKCKKCGKREVFFGLKRDDEWETKNNHLRTHEVF